MYNIKTIIGSVAAIVIIGSISANFFLFDRVGKLTDERNQYKGNVEGLMTSMEELKTDTAHKALQVQTLSLSLDEYKKYRSEDAQLIKDLKIKLKQVTAVANQQMEVKAPIAALVKDTVVIRDTIPLAIKTITYADKHITFNGTIENDSLKAKVNVPINITQVLYKVPKHKFLWWSWGCKAVKQVIVTDNPYVNINYLEYIEIK